MDITLEKVVRNEKNKFTIDHIWAKDDSKLDLSDEEKEIHDEIKHMVGNLTLVTGSRNSEWQHDPYGDKRTKDRYHDSDFRITRDVAINYTKWGEDQVKERTREIVKFALKR